MNFHQLCDGVTVFCEKVAQPKVGLPATGLAWLFGHISAQDWLTYLSLVFVIIQIYGSIPKIIDATKRIKTWWRDK